MIIGLCINRMMVAAMTSLDDVDAVCTQLLMPPHLQCYQERLQWGAPPIAAEVVAPKEDPKNEHFKCPQVHKGRKPAYAAAAKHRLESHCPITSCRMV